MPLSEDEQRILQQIEQQFYATDPDLAGEIGNHSLYTHCLRRMRWAAAIFVVGLAPAAQERLEALAASVVDALDHPAPAPA